eukprot:scaffold6501_cov323-Prasinococcus_capsulatus_cf.AAC.6
MAAQGFFEPLAGLLPSDMLGRVAPALANSSLDHELASRSYLWCAMLARVAVGRRSFVVLRHERACVRLVSRSTAPCQGAGALQLQAQAVRPCDERVARQPRVAPAARRRHSAVGHGGGATAAREPPRLAHRQRGAVVRPQVRCGCALRVRRRCCCSEEQRLILLALQLVTNAVVDACARSVTFWIPVSGHQQAYALLLPHSHEFAGLVRQRGGDVKQACAPSCDADGVMLMQGASSSSI